MNRLRLIRGLRIAWSVWWGILCVLLVMLWVRSYWWVDGFAVLSPNSIQNFTIASKQSQVMVQYLPDASPQRRWTIYRQRLSDFPGPPATSSLLGFAGDSTSLGWTIFIPHWFLVSLAASLAAFPLLRSRWHYSLRTLLISITLIAVGLGLVVIMRR